MGLDSRTTDLPVGQICRPDPKGGGERRNPAHCGTVQYATLLRATAAILGPAQKPSSARPTQLNANIEQTTAATDAKVAIVFAERMIRTLW